jgi:lipopolysaccharide biosynthesis protein
MTIWRKIGTLSRWLFDDEKSISDFRKRAEWKPELLIPESESLTKPEPIAITAHVFYEDFAKELISGLSNLTNISKVYVTTPSKDIKLLLENYLSKSTYTFDVRLTPNIGRNFGPLFVEFSKVLLEEKSFIHVHSKKSLHSPGLAIDWLARNTDLFLSREGLSRVERLAQSDSRIGMVFVDASDLLFGINYRWGRSLPVAKKIFGSFKGFENIKWSGRLSFPAGGMFWAKTEAIRPLLEMDWDYSMFPIERGQGDGELQHAIERMVGQLPLSRGFSHTIYMKAINRFRTLEL